MTNLEPKYTLFNSLDQMLALETLSELLSQLVTHMDIQPMEHGGATGAQLSWVHTNVGRLVLKQMSMDMDFAMFITSDHHCRSVTLWQYGLLDKLLPHLEHKIIACAQEGNTWTIMMEDLEAGVFSQKKDSMPRNLIHPSLDNLARMHATFWNHDYLKDPRLGLNSPKDWLLAIGRSRTQKVDPSLGDLSGWFKLLRSGWEVMEDLLSAEVFMQIQSLVETPKPFLNALERYPFTLVHADYKKENMAYRNRFILFDWQLAACSLMTYDLAWYTEQENIQDALGVADASRYYRERLETHLNQRFDEIEWQAMRDLGFALHASWATLLYSIWYKENENPDKRVYHEKIVQKQGQLVMDALRWL